MARKIKTPFEIISSNIVVPKLIMIFTGAAVLFYFTWWLDLNNAENIILYTLLVIGEIYHVWQAFGYIYTTWDQRKFETKTLDPKKAWPAVDIFITVCGEPPDIVEKTIKAATSLNYSNYKVHVLNDGLSRNLTNWKEIDDLAIRHGA